METKLKLPLIAAWTAFALALVIRLTLDAGNILIVMTGVIALSITGVVVTRLRSGPRPAQ